MFDLRENGEMSCFSFAQLMDGGGTLWTSQDKTTSSSSITDILTGSDEPPAPPTLDLGRTEKANNILIIFAKIKPKLFEPLGIT